MGDRLIERDAHGRLKVNLFRWPRRLQLAMALGIVGVVVLVARLVDPNPLMPRWLQTAIRVSGWIYLGVTVVVLVGWLVRRRR